MDIPRFNFSFAPYRLSGTVYAALLNDPRQVASLGNAVNAPPYKAPPIHPVLSVKPRNTLSCEGATVVVPMGVIELAMGPTLGIIIGQATTRVAEVSALSVVAGYAIVNDISIPLHGPASHYRPAARNRARDGFCPIGSRVTPAREVTRPDALAVRVRVDGALVHQSSTAARTRNVAKLIADVSDFMTLQAGDLLLLGAAHGAPLARAGQSVTIEIDALGQLTHYLVAEGVRA
jgi:5-oxopent-3-ene-1,2,5-tricarboxylate decarboxylase / 2-hydroxyhepta-2,4-diene-1,7-dioate isomerase